MIPRIAIVGGGIAGWMAAARLATALKRHGTIQLVATGNEHVDAAIATMPPLRAFHAGLGVDEDDLIRKTQATFLLGTVFSGWPGAPRDFFHGYGDYGQSVETVGFHHCWYRLREMGDPTPLEAYALGTVAALLGKFQRPATDLNSVLSGFSYGLHVDGGLYRDYLRALAVARGVISHTGSIERVRMHDNGSIAGLTLAGQEVDADLFVDTTDGGALIANVMAVGWDDWSRWLPSDRMRITSHNSEVFPPHARAVAEGTGWQLEVPLRDRTVTVSILDRGDTDTAERVHAVRNGRRDVSWKKNCVALGMAAGFLEPLEGTETHLVYGGLNRLLTLLPATAVCDPADVAEYNRLTALEWDHARDFLILHRLGGADAAAHDDLPHRLQHKLDVFRSRARMVPYPGETIPHASWLALFNGLGIEPVRYHPFADGIAIEDLKHRMATLRSVIRQAAESMPSHEAFLARIAS